jgi:hypothetical protein
MASPQLFQSDLAFREFLVDKPQLIMLQKYLKAELELNSLPSILQVSFHH